MRPNERRDSGQQDLLRSRLDQIVDPKPPLVQLTRSLDWQFLEQRFGESYTDRPGRPPLPTRLMAGLAILQHTPDLSDEVLRERSPLTSCSAARSSSVMRCRSTARR